MNRKEINRLAKLIKKQGESKLLNHLPQAIRRGIARGRVIDDYYLDLIDHHFQHKSQAKRKIKLKDFVLVLQELQTLEQEITRMMEWRNCPEGLQRFRKAGFLERRKIAYKYRNYLYASKLKEWVTRQQAIIEDNAESIQYIFGECATFNKLVSFVKFSLSLFISCFIAASLYIAFTQG